MNKFLILGSAPYVDSWFEKNKDRFMQKKFQIVSMNNAWRISKDKTDFWVHSNDFEKLGNKVPSKEEMQKWVEVVDFIKKPFWYHCPGSGTMLLNTLYHFLNLVYKSRFIFVIAGSDFIYTGGKTHFYGCGIVTSKVKGLLSKNCPNLENKAADPLRFGKEWLINELCKFNTLVTNCGGFVFNVGGQKETLLPFKRIFFL